LPDRGQGEQASLGLGTWKGVKQGFWISFIQLIVLAILPMEN
jgi:hypothetical protein